MIFYVKFCLIKLMLSLLENSKCNSNLEKVNIVILEIIVVHNMLLTIVLFNMFIIYINMNQ